MSKRWITLFALGAFILMLGVTGCATKSASKTQVLKVGSDTTYAPFGFQDEKTKDYVGFDIDLIKAIGKQAGYDIQIENMNFDGLIPGLESGNIDVAISDMTITAERSKSVNFSKPYYTAGLSIVVRTDNNTLKDFKDLEGKKIAVSIGSTGAEEAHKIKNAQVTEFNMITEAFLELRNGGVDAVINDAPVNEYFILHEGNKYAKIVGKPLNSEDLGIATSMKNPELGKKIDKALDELKKNGEYEKIYIKWFGKKPPL